jgi:DNA polymerase III subunit alpha
LLVGIVTDLRVVNGQRGKVAIFRLDDKTEPIESVVNEELLTPNTALLREDELLILQGKVQPDRFSGGVRLNVQQIWDLPSARARFGKYLAIAVNGRVPPVAPVVAEFPARQVSTEQGDLVQGLSVRLQLQREAAYGELDLGEEARFWPSDAALARWRESAQGGVAQVVYG